MKKLPVLAIGLAAAMATLNWSQTASGQSDGWVTLLDGSKMGDWTEVGKANWAMKDGALVADKLDGKLPQEVIDERVAHIRESKAGGSILESAVTTFLYPNSRNTPQELAPLALTDRELDFACLSALEARLALIRSGGVSAIVDMDLRPLGGLMRVLGGGAGGDWAPEGWRDTPDFWKEIA